MLFTTATLSLLLAVYADDAVRFGVDNRGLLSEQLNLNPVGEEISRPQTGSNRNAGYQGNVAGPSQLSRCYCLRQNSPCNANIGTSDGAGIIDERIVNREEFSCPKYQKLCCPSDYVSTRPTYRPTQPTYRPTQPTYRPNPYQTCGKQNIISVPNYSSKPNEAKFGEFPWMAVILQQERNEYVAGAVLIHPRFVLTTAHRVDRYRSNYGGLKVRLGEWDSRNNNENPGYVERYVKRLHVHEAYSRSGNHFNNVALLELSEPVYVDQYPHINTVCLPTQGQQFYAGQRCWVSGWGKDDFGPQGQYQPILNKVDLPIIDHAECQRRLRTTELGYSFVLNRKSFICAGGEPGKDACTGDGGSPLVCKVGGSYYLAGLVSWGIGCADKNPGAYTNVANYADWTKGTIRRQGYSFNTGAGGSY